MFNVLKSVEISLLKENLVKVFRRFFPENKLFIMVMGYTVVLSIICMLKHWFFLSTAWDLGIFNQSFWSTIHGRFFYYTVEPWFGDNFFAMHFSPILIFLVPFYAIYPQPETLLVLQSLIIAMGVVPLYHLAKEVINHSFALKLSLVYIINPTIIGANLFDFHVEIFLPITLISLMYFLHKRNFKFYTLFLFLSLSTLEFTAFLTLLIIIYELVINWRRKDEVKRLVPFTVLTLIASVVWLFTAFLVSYSLRVPETKEQSILAPIIMELFQNPGNLFFRITENIFPKLWYILMMLWPFLFTPLLSPRVTLVAPWFFVAFALNYGPYYAIGYQYALVVIPFFAVASIYGTKRLLSYIGAINWGKISKLLIVSALTFAIWAIATFQFSLPYFDEDYAQRVNRVISYLPGNASVLTINSFHPHVSSRWEAWVLPLTYNEPYEGYYTGISDVWKNYAPNFLRTKEPDFILWDINKRGIEAYNLNLTIHELLSRVHYGVYVFLDGIILLKKGYVDTPLIYEMVNCTYTYANLTIYPPCQTISDPSSRSGTVLFYNGTENQTFLETTMLFLPKGNYSIKMRIKTSGITNETSNIFMLQVNTGNEYLNFTVFASDVQENVWEEVNLDFEVKNTLACVSLNGTSLSTNIMLYIDYINIQAVTKNEGE
ncbi:MAG: DUF2079 domain-containing protein [Candidatus Bathyarchaeia archaeon]